MKFIIKYRWPIIIFSIMLCIGLAGSLTKIEIDPDLKNYFPESMESMLNTEKIEDVFGSQDIIMLLFETDDIINKESLNRIKQVERKLKRVDGIRKTTSLFGSNHIYGQDGVMYIEPAIRRMPESQAEVLELKETLKANDLLINIVLADDFRSAAIISTLAKDANEDSVFNEISSILEEFPGREKVHFGGLPYLRQAMNKDISRDALILVPAALLLMVIFLFVVFREWRGVFLPFLVVILSSVIALAIIPLIHWKFYLITLLVPVMLIAVANDYGIHMIAKYQELNKAKSRLSMSDISVFIAEKLWKPILLTGITTIAGISALLAHTMIPARQMALIASIGIVFALFYSIVLLPAILSLMKAKPPKHYQRSGRRELMHKLAFFIIRRNRQIPLYTLVITVLIGLGIVFLKVDSNEENFFPDKHPVKQASKLINANYGGSENLSVMFEGDMLDPLILERIDLYKKKLLERSEIDLIMTFPDVIKEISKSLNDPGSPLYNKIPAERDAVAQYMELYNMNGDPENLDQLVDFNYEHSHMLIRINSVSNRDVNEIIEYIKALSATDKNLAAIGGYGYVRCQLADKVLKGQFYSLAIALVIILVVLSLIFKSIKAGLIGSIPVVISIILLFGIMGLLGIRLDVATALLSSLMIGVGVDYSIHFLWRYREERMLHRPAKEAVITTISTTGRGILFNALSVIVGFIVLLFSSFTPIRFFGALVVVSISSCLAGALLVLPALVLRYKFKFLEPKEKNMEIVKGQAYRKAI